MTTPRNTVSMMKVLPEADLVEIQNFTQKLFNLRSADCPLPPKSKEEIYKDLETSRKQATERDFQEASEFLAEVRKEYGI